MNLLTVNLGERSYPIHIQSAGLKDIALLQKLIPHKHIVAISNNTVAPLYCDSINTAFCERTLDWILLPDGEQHKTLASFETIMTRLLEQHAARDTCLIALGGGVIGDMTGFAAACYMRGIDFVQIPTTLLSQVDSSVGGKTAVNHPLGKNMIGAFHQPVAVMIDPDTLTTLPEREFAAGMAEVIKYGIIEDAEFFAWLESHTDQLKALQPEALQTAIYRSCEIKAKIVAADEKEQGQRALLNLGHTFGHAIEAEMGYGRWLHGEAVAAGMVIAAEVAERLGWITASEVCRIQHLISAFSLPTSAPDGMDYQAFMRHMQHDKKVKSGKIRFVIPKQLGLAVVTELSQEVLIDILGG